MAKREPCEQSRGRRAAAAARAILRRAQASEGAQSWRGSASGRSTEERRERGTGESELTNGESERKEEFKVD